MTKNNLTYASCNECATIYMTPRPPPAVLDWFYKDSKNYSFWNDVAFPASETVRRQKIFVPRVNQVIEIAERQNLNMGSVLEVGAGFGTFCVELISRNIFKKVVGVEPTPKLAATCRSRGIEVIEKPIEYIDVEGDGFDLVVNFEVIEHLFSPRAFVEAMAKLLRPGGLMVLTCPNGLGFDVQTLGPASDTVDHEHLNYFNPTSLSGLLARCGLETIESSTPGKLDADLVREKVLAGKADLSREPFLKRILIDEWNELGEKFQHFLIDAGLSSNMWLVARKAMS